MSDEGREAEVQRRLILPYHRVISGDEADGYIGSVPELPGCMTAGDTPAEALTNLDEAMAAWIESCMISGDAIPEPAWGEDTRHSLRPRDDLQRHSRFTLPPVRHLTPSDRGPASLRRPR